MGIVKHLPKAPALKLEIINDDDDVVMIEMQIIKTVYNTVMYKQFIWKNNTNVFYLLLFCRPRMVGVANVKDRL